MNEKINNLDKDIRDKILEFTKKNNVSVSDVIMSFDRTLVIYTEYGSNEKMVYRIKHD